MEETKTMKCPRCLTMKDTSQFEIKRSNALPYKSCHDCRDKLFRYRQRKKGVVSEETEVRERKSPIPKKTYAQKETPEWRKKFLKFINKIDDFEVASIYFKLRSRRTGILEKLEEIYTSLETDAERDLIYQLKYIVLQLET